jgi:hypothetical protein
MGEHQSLLPEKGHLLRADFLSPADTVPDPLPRIASFEKTRLWDISELGALFLLGRGAWVQEREAIPTSRWTDNRSNSVSP